MSEQNGKQLCCVGSGMMECPVCRGVWWLFRNPWLGLASRVFLAGIFIFASLDKIAHPPQFARSVLNYEFFPVWTVNLIAIMVPWVELIVGVLLLAGLFTYANNLIVFGMLWFFFVLIAQALVRGLEIDCGCFSVHLAGQIMDWTYLVRDVGFILCSVQLFTARRLVLALDELRRA